jgi:protocatechuate 3,4-dioxygenase beta subunit
MHATAWPEELDVEAGEVANFSVTVTNTSTMIDAYQVQVFGIDPKWVTSTPTVLSLFPGDVDTMNVSIALPIDYPSSRRRLALTVRSENDPEEFALTHTEIGVNPSTTVDVSIDPPMMQGGRVARFGIVVGNTGNATISATPVALDPEDLSEFTFSPLQVDVPPGQNRVVQVTARGGRAWLGNPRARTFMLGVETDARIERPATFIQRPRIGRWLITLLGLLAAVAIFSLVLSRAFQSVIDTASIDSRVLESALDDGTGDGAVIPVNPVTVTGGVVAQSTGGGVPGIQVELFDADDTNVALSSAVTDDNGIYAFGGLNTGTYKLRFTGAGFNPVWYEAGPTAAAATDVEVEAGKELPPLNDIVIGGRPGSLSGLVIADDPSGAIATLLVEGEIDPTNPPIVAQVDVSADGSFVFEAVPSPAVYTLQVEKVGFARESRRISLEAGQALSGVEVTLRPDDGVITGVISDAAGPLGGAAVVATDGSNTIETVSLTVDGNRGWYALRNLAVPGRYTVTVSRDGYATESRNVVLDGSFAPTVDIAMSSSIGSIAGFTTDAADTPLSGVTVRAVGADFTTSTTSISQEGPEGRFFIERIPIPGSYTLTFSKPGYASRVLLVELDARLGTADTDGLRVALTRSTASLRGEVTDKAGNPLSQATVKLSNGSTTYQQLSADQPLGSFAFTDVPPGSYTLTATRQGSSDTVIPVNLQAGVERFETLRLGDQAGISGRVVVGSVGGGSGTNSPPAVNYPVRLFLSAEFPNGTEVSEVFTDADGRFNFSPVDANIWYVVAVYAEPGASNANPLDSVSVLSQEGVGIVVDRDLVVGVVN